MRQRAVFWLWGMLTASLALAQDTKITVPLGWYSAEELAQALSSETRTVSVHPQLRQRVLLVHLRDRSFEEVRQLLRKGTGIRIEPTGARRWRLEWDPDVLRREQRWRQQVARELDKEIAQRMQELATQIPPLPAKYLSDLQRVGRAFRDEVDCFRLFGEVGDGSHILTSEGIVECLRRKLETDLDKFQIPHELEQWARAMTKLPDYLDYDLTLQDISRNYPDLKMRADELRFRELLYDGVFTLPNPIMYYHTILATALMYQEPSLRVSALEAMEQGMSVRTVPLAQILIAFPQLDSLRVTSVEWYSLSGDTSEEEQEQALENLRLAVRLTLYPEPDIVFAIVSGGESTWDRSLLRPRFIKPPTDDPPPLVDRWLLKVGQEGRRYVNEAHQATERALQHPKLNTEFAVPSGMQSDHLSKWVYLWAQATDSEVVMLPCPADDGMLKANTNKTTLAQLYQSRDESQRYSGEDTRQWTLRMVDEVLLVENRRNFISRLHDYPLASLKWLIERCERLTYEDLRRYYRSVSPEQNRWWFLIPFQWEVPPFCTVKDSEGFQRDYGSLFTWGQLWFAMAVLESLSEPRRNEILASGGRLIRLDDIAPAARRQLTDWVRKSLINPEYGLVSYHPAYEIRERWREGRRWDGNSAFMEVRIERRRIEEGKERIILRSRTDFYGGDPEEVFTFSHWQNWEDDTGFQYDN